jgi:ureidoglycolate dehydrogenase (NAD+)
VAVSAGNVTFAPNVLRGYAERLLTAGGFRPDDARKAADLLVWANLRGADSHGVLRIPRYVGMVGAGLINPGANPRVVSEHGAVALVDADLAPGATGMELVMKTAVKTANRLVPAFAWDAISRTLAPSAISPSTWRRRV